jgi:hypothetical protein
MKTEDKGISPQSHKDQHKGTQRRQKTVQKTEGKGQKGDKGRQRPPDHLDLSAFLCSLSVLFLLF